LQIKTPTVRKLLENNFYFFPQETLTQLYEGYLITPTVYKSWEAPQPYGELGPKKTS